MKTIKFTCIASILMSFLLLTSSFQEVSKTEEIVERPNIIGFSDATELSAIAYLFSEINYNANYSIGEFHFSSINRGYIELYDSQASAFSFFDFFINLSEELGRNIGDFTFECITYYGMDTAQEIVEGTYAPLRITSWI